MPVQTPATAAPGAGRRPGLLSIARFLALVVLLAALLGVRLGTGGALVPAHLAGTFKAIGHGPWALPMGIALYLAGSLMALPGPVLLYAATTSLGLALGLASAGVATMVSAAVVFILGRVLGRDYLESRHPDAVRRCAGILATNGTLRVLQLRLIPLIPFHLVNASCGALSVPPRAFLVATLIGMVPKIGVELFFVQAVQEVTVDSALQWSAQIGVGLALLAITLVVGHRAMRRGQSAAVGARRNAPEVGPL